MPANRIRRSDLTPPGDGGSAGITVQTNGQLTINRDGTNKETIATDKVKAITADDTLTAQDDGATIIFNSTTTLTATLPPPAAGLRFRFFVKTAATSGNGHTIALNGSTEKLYAEGFTAAGGKGAVDTEATGAQGDAFEVQSDGTDWIGVKLAGTWARQA